VYSLKEDNINISDLYNSLIKEIVNEKNKIVIISSEMFDRNQNIDNLGKHQNELLLFKQKIEDLGFKINIVMYVRNLLEFLKSFYIEHLKIRNSSNAENFYFSKTKFEKFEFSDFVNMVCYQNYIHNLPLPSGTYSFYSTFFERDNIIVKFYNRDFDKNFDIIEDFCKTTNIIYTGNSYEENVHEKKYLILKSKIVTANDISLLKKNILHREVKFANKTLSKKQKGFFLKGLINE
jgi:hypothetical protein